MKEIKENLDKKSVVSVLIINNNNLEKMIYIQNRTKSFLPKLNREQMDPDEYIFDILLDTYNHPNDLDFYMITDKALYKKREY